MIANYLMIASYLMIANYLIIIRVKDLLHHQGREDSSAAIQLAFPVPIVHPIVILPDNLDQRPLQERQLLVGLSFIVIQCSCPGYSCQQQSFKLCKVM